MKCLNCQKEFISSRSDAKFDSDSCRKAYARKSDIKADNLSEIIKSDTDNVTDKGTPKEEKGTTFTPNWKRKGYSSAREGLLAAMVALGENSALEGQVFHLGTASFEVKKRKMVRIA